MGISKNEMLSPPNGKCIVSAEEFIRLGNMPSQYTRKFENSQLSFASSQKPGITLYFYLKIKK
jgi:hypothetical protein